VENSARSALWPSDNLSLLLLGVVSMTLIGVIGGSLAGHCLYSCKYMAIARTRLLEHVSSLSSSLTSVRTSHCGLGDVRWTRYRLHHPPAHPRSRKYHTSHECPHHWHLPPPHGHHLEGPPRHMRGAPTPPSVGHVSHWIRCPRRLLSAGLPGGRNTSRSMISRRATRARMEKE